MYHPNQITITHDDFLIIVYLLATVYSIIILLAFIGICYLCIRCYLGRNDD